MTTCKTFALACAFVARFCRQGHPNSASHNVHLEFRLSELMVWAGDGENIAWVKLAVPPTAFCDVGVSIQLVSTLRLTASDLPFTVTQTPEGVWGPDWMGAVGPVPRPVRTDWYARMIADASSIPGMHHVGGRSFGDACLGLLTLGNFPSMDNAIHLRKRLDHIQLTNTDRLRDGIIEAGALLKRVDTYERP